MNANNTMNRTSEQQGNIKENRKCRDTFTPQKETTKIPETHNENKRA